MVGVLQEHEVELAAIYVVGVVAVLHTFLLALFKTNIDVVIRRQALEIVDIARILIVGRPDRAEFVREFRCFHLRQEVEVFEYAGRRRNQGLAHMRPRKQLAFKDYALYSSLREVTTHARSGGASADNRYIKIRH
jgi:hypothetical protein